MFLKTVCKQGNKIFELENQIKQLKEENQCLRDELDFSILDKDRLIRNLNTIIECGNKNKVAYYFILEKIQKELSAVLTGNR